MDAFVDVHRHEHGVEPICTVLADAGIQIAPSSYYVARCTIERRMRALGLTGVPNARTTRTTRPAPPG